VAAPADGADRGSEKRHPVGFLDFAVRGLVIGENSEAAAFVSLIEQFDADLFTGAGRRQHDIVQ